jgi:hypothetical protein
MMADERAVPDLLLERYRLKELPADELRALERRLEKDPDLRERLRRLDDSDAEIRRRCPPEWLASQVRAATKQQRPEWRPHAVWRVHWLPAALVVGAALVLVLAPATFAPGPDSAFQPAPADGVRLKGLEPGLILFRRTAEGSEELADGAPARAGDLIRVGYRAAGSAYGAIVSIDGRGAVTRHLPVSGELAEKLEAGAVVLLDHAYQLDDAPRWERFYFVTSDARFTLAPVLEAARREAVRPDGDARGLLKLEPALHQSVISLGKETQ